MSPTSVAERPIGLQVSMSVTSGTERCVVAWEVRRWKFLTKSVTFNNGHPVQALFLFMFIQLFP
jgi:hypothetical protein